MRRINLKIILIISLITVVWGAAHAYSQTVTYTYDDFNRIKKTEYAGAAAVEYTFDKVGNRQTKNETFGLKDVIAILELLTGSGDKGACSGADINGDGKIGLEELIYVMQCIAGLK
jgi:hypothetical protein